MKKNLLAFGLMLIGATLLAQTPRLVLYEEFTGETCPPCASANPILNALLASPTNTPKVIAIKWQVPIPSAPSKPWSLYQTNKAEIDWRYRSVAAGGYGYNPAINSAPSGKMDGQQPQVFGAASGHPNSLNNTVISTAQSYTSAFNITMQRDWNYNCSAITLTVNITASAPFTVSQAGKLKFRCVMIERLIQFSVQPGTNGETTFEDVAIKSFPTIQQGTALADSWTNNQSMTFTLNCPIPSYTRKKEEIAFVGFIQDDGNQHVAQACLANKAALPSDGLAALAANVDVACTNQITPKITINNTGSNAITQMTVIPYIDGVAQAQVNWTGNIPVSTTSVISLNPITAPTTPGAHTFSYNITSLGTSQYNISGNSSMVNFMVAGAPNANPIAEGFVLGTFPPAGWVAVNPDQGNSWLRTTATGGYFLSLNALRYNFFDNGVANDVDELIMPRMDLTGSTAPDMTFDYAYAQRNSSSNDQLDVLVSDNCGATWTNVWSKQGANLATAAAQTFSYIPDIQDFTQWQTAQISLNGFNKSGVLVKFVTTASGVGNNLFIDNINLRQNNPPAGDVGINVNNGNTFAMNVYPNPAIGETSIKIHAVNAGTVKVLIFNALGQAVYNNTTNVQEGSNTLNVDVKNFAAGIYNVVVDNQSVSITKKLTVTK